MAQDPQSEFDVLERSSPWHQTRVLEGDGEAATQLEPHRLWIESSDLHMPASSANGADEHIENRGLPRPCGSEENHALTPPDRQTEVGDGGPVSEVDT
jgi:hypothetical protein